MALNQIAAEPPSPVDSEYKIEFVRTDGHISAVIGGQVIAETDNAVIAHETHLPSTFYIPRDDFKPGVLRRDDMRTFCPFKGTAVHWSVNLPEKTLPNAAWSYERPLEISSALQPFMRNGFGE